MTDQEQLIDLLEEAEREGENRGYQKGYGDALNSIDIKSSSEEEAESQMNRHNVTNFAVDEFLSLVPDAGYSKDDPSLLIPQLHLIQEKTKSASWTESPRPYIVQGSGDLVTMTDDRGVTFDYTPYRETFRLLDLLADKTYDWKMSKDGKVIKTGSFQTYGRAGMMAFDSITNVRDLYVPNILKSGIVFRGANPDETLVDSEDHKRLQKLGITTQINLRNQKDDPARNDLFSKTYSYNVEDYANILSNTTNIKNVFNALAESLERGDRIFINCFAGADRTGTICYLIQAICGVPAGILQAHWELTSLSRWCNFKLWSYERKDNYPKGELRSFVLAMIKSYGSNPYEQAYNYLVNKVGVKVSTIQCIQKHLMY